MTEHELNETSTAELAARLAEDEPAAVAGWLGRLADAARGVAGDGPRVVALRVRADELEGCSGGPR